MRNLKKLVALIVTVALMLTLAIPAFAATPTDVKGTDYEGAVTRLVALGVITGYPDGSFGPGDSITRAQFAAVVVRSLGYEDVAATAKGVTKFSDVGSTHWAAGYINLAVSLGVINGYGNGKFGPDDKVTYEQAVTMVVRALGQDFAAVLKGGFPTGYLLQAKVIGFTNGVKGVAGTPATRGIVAQLIDNAKAVKIYVQETVGASQSYKESADSFLTKLGISQQATGKIVTETPATGMDANKFVAGGVTYTAVAGTVDVNSLLGKKVDLWGSAVDKIVLAENLVGAAVAVKTVNDVTVADGVYTVKTTLADGTDKSFTAVAGGGAYENLAVKTLVTAANDLKGAAAGKVELSFIADGANLQFINATKYTVVAEGSAAVENKVLKTIKLGDYTIKDADGSAKLVIVKDGATVDYTAIKDGDILFVYNAGAAAVKDNTIIIKATSKTVAGTLEAAKPNLAAATSIKVEGTWYTPTAATIDVSGIMGKEVTLTLDPAGNVYSVAGPAAVASTAKYGVVLASQKTDATLLADAVYQAKILTSTGDKTVYTVKAGVADAAIVANSYADKLVKYTVNADGIVDGITVASEATLTAKKFDKTRMQFNGIDMNSGVVMFTTAQKVLALTGITDGDNATANTYMTNSDGEIVAMLILDGSYTVPATANNYGYVTDYTALDSSYTMDLVTKDGAKSIDTTASSVYEVKGKLVNYTLNADGKISAIANVANTNTAKATVTYVDASKIKVVVNGVTSTYWFATNSMVIYDTDRDGAGVQSLTKADLYKDMEVDVVADGSSNVIAVIVTKM